jgi:hypothetical protein
VKKLMLLCLSLLAAAFSIATTPLHAQTLAWVSPTGSDANSCTQTAPCATFAGAILKGGNQINCLGSGNYGTLNSTTVSITGSLVIDCGAGNVGEMTAGAGTAVININTVASATIVLRHLSLSGNGGGGTLGINTQNFGSGTLIVENCTVRGTANAVIFAPSSGRGTLQITDSRFFGNSGDAINVAPFTGQIASIALNRVEIVANSASGLALGGSGVIAGTIRQSLVAHNAVIGIAANAAGGVFFTVEESSVINNLATGIFVNSSAAVVNVGASTIGGNGTGVKVFAGSLVSFGNNQMSANGVNGSFTSTAGLQ